jgi:tetratricopeptide (TPR) repeat protein
MSPEQAAGALDRLSARSDVYSLGATLYYLLTGKPPVSGDDVGDLLQAVRNGDFPHPRQRDTTINRGLEAVCLKAMALNPGDRYTTPRELAEDIERWLADEPVSVLPEPLSTRLNRWSRRHKWLVGGVAGLLVTAVLSLAVATGVVNEQKREARQARKDADLAKERAEEHLRVGLDVVEELVTLGDKQLISPKESTATREQLLSRALGFVRRFRERRSEDPEIQAKSAQVARRLANLYRLRGEFALAQPPYNEALALIEDLRRRFPDHREFDDLLAETLLDLAESMFMAGRSPAAEELFERARVIAEELAVGSEQGSMYRRTWGRSLYRLASVGLTLGRENTLSCARKGVEQLRSLADPSLPGAKDKVLSGQTSALTDQLELIIAQGFLAEGLKQAGYNSEAERELREAISRMDRVADQFRDVTIDDIAYFHAATNMQLARLLIERKGYVGAEALARLDDAIGRLTGIVERSPKVRHWCATLGQAYTVRSRTHELSGQADLSSMDAGRAREVLQSLVTQYPGVPEHLSDLAEVQDSLRRLALARGDQEAATHQLLEAIRLQRKALEVAPENRLFQERLSRYQLSEARPAR